MTFSRIFHIFQTDVLVSCMSVLLKRRSPITSSSRCVYFYFPFSFFFFCLACSSVILCLPISFRSYYFLFCFSSERRLCQSSLVLFLFPPFLRYPPLSLFLFVPLIHAIILSFPTEARLPHYIFFSLHPSFMS